VLRRRRLGVGGFWFRLLVVVPVGEIFEPPSGGGGGRRRRRFRARAWGHRRLVFKMIDFSNCQSRLLLKKKRDPQTLSKKNENNDQHQRGPRARTSSRGETSASPVSREPPPRSDEETDIDFCEDV